MTFSWFCQGLLLPLQHHLKVVPFSNIFWGIFTLLSTVWCSKQMESHTVDTAHIDAVAVVQTQ